MSKISPNLKPQDFLKMVRKSGILSEDQFASWLDKVRSSNSLIRTSTQQLSEDLLDSGLVTSWQVKKLLEGKYKGFFIGNYKILKHIGSGGMSAVYLAEQELTRQQRAIKVLPKDKLKEKSYLARFYREAQAVATLNHQNIVRVYDVTRGQGTHYMVMEYAEGPDLHRMVTDSGPLSVSLAENCICQTALGLSASHDKSIIHRDIKPANLVMTASEQIKILDLGLALLKSEHNAFGISAQHDESVMGTVDFLSPEQAINSHNIDHRADIYSLGCTMHFLLTGQPPFPSGTLAQRITAHQTQQPPDITSIRHDCPEHLASICRKMLAKNPEDRFYDGHEIIDAIKNRHAPTDSLPAKQTTVSLRTAGRSKLSSHLPWWIAACFLSLVTMLATILSLQGQGGNANSNTSINPPIANSNYETPLTHPQPAANAPTVTAGERTNPTSTPAERIIDFNNRATYQHARKSVKLIANRELIGHLENLTRNDFESVPSADQADRCLWIEANSKIPFRPHQPDQFLKKIIIDARSKQSADGLMVTISAKHSISGNHRWQEIRDISPQLRPDKFSQIVLDADLFTTMKYRKFRINVSGTSGDGIYIRSILINFQPAE